MNKLLVEKLQELYEWYETANGQTLLQEEEQCIQKVLNKCFGYYLVQFGDSRLAALTEASAVRHKYFYTFKHQSKIELAKNSLVGKIDNLPFQVSSLDVVVLPHILEYVDEPQVLLEEVNDILIASGYLIILCFDPWSIWHLAQMLIKRKKLPAQSKYFSYRQLKILLNKQGFVVEEAKKCGFSFPNYQPFSFLQRWWFILSQLGWPDMGNVNIILARKQSSVLTSLPCKWTIKTSKKAIIETSSLYE